MALESKAVDFAVGQLHAALKYLAEAVRASKHKEVLMGDIILLVSNRAPIVDRLLRLAIISADTGVDRAFQRVIGQILDNVYAAQLVVCTWLQASKFLPNKLRSAVTMEAALTRVLEVVKARFDDLQALQVDDIQQRVADMQQQATGISSAVRASEERVADLVGRLASLGTLRGGDRAEVMMQAKAIVDRSSTGQKLKGHTDTVRSVAWSQDGRTLATGSSDATAALWDAETGRRLCVLKGHTSAVVSVAWSPDGSMLVTGSSDTTAALWDAATGRRLHLLEGHNSWQNGDGASTESLNRVVAQFACRVSEVAWSPDGRMLATGSEDKTAALWDAKTGRRLRLLEGHLEGVRSVVWSPDGRRLATGSIDKTSVLWDAESGRHLRVLEGHTGSVFKVAWSPDGRTLATASYDKTAALWDAETGRRLRVLEGHMSLLYSVAWSPDGRTLATGSDDKTAALWDTETGRRLRVLDSRTNYVNNGVCSVAWSSDGRTLATGSSDKSARLWSVSQNV